MKLSIKLLFAFTLVGIVPLAITNTIYFNQAKKILSEQSFNQLKTIRDLKKVQVERFFAQRQTDMDVLVQTIAKFKGDSLAKLTALQELKKAQIEEFFIGLHNDMSVLARSETLKEMFLKLKKHYKEMAVSPDGPFEVTSEQYQQIYSSKLSSFFINSIKTLKYSNLYIIYAPYGHVMYTVTQSSDLGTNLNTGPYREEGLARLWRKVVKTKTIVIEDFSPYTPLGGQQTAFIGAPLFDETQQQMTSIIALPIPKEAINTIIQRRDGLGRTGETYLVGKTNNIIHYRSDRLLKSSQIGDPIQGAYIKKALQGETGITIQTNSTGVLEVIFYHPLHIQGLEWMISTAISYEELLAPKGKHPNKDFYTHYLEKYGDYDLFLIHPQGTVFYSVKHEADYHTNILKGQYAQTGLGKAVKHVLKTKQYTLIDVEHYPPSDQAAAFIAQPLLEDNQITLIVAIQLSADTLNRALHWRIARDKSSETYLVGSDKLMRSDSDLDPEHHSIFAAFANPDRGQVDTIASREALSGQTGEKKLTNYQGDKVLSVYTPVEIADSIRWALIAEIHQTEAFAAIDSIHFIILILFGIAILIVIIVATLLMRSIIKPITAVIDFSNQVKNGNTETVLEMNRRDEIGQMGAALNHMVLAQRQTIKQIQHAGIQVSSSATELAATAKQQKATMLNQLAFTHHVEHSMDDISKVAAELVHTMEQVADMSSETAEFTTHSQAELARMEAAMHSMEKASRSISYKLEAINEKTENITSVVTTITKVADQTNLLSLNAAIEAEKAGEYGRGFNVVAREIRRLADQTAIATLDIEQMVKEMQSAVAAGVMEMDKFITEVKRSAEDVGKISLQLKRIIEQVQALSPQFEEVKVAMTKQSQSAQEINHAMVDVGDGMQQTADSLEESFHAIEQLNEAARSLQEEVLCFQNRSSSSPKETV